MALSNMGREPRREWTEQLFGLLVLLIFAVVYVVGLRKFWEITGTVRIEDRVGSGVLGLLFFAGGLLLLVALWYFAHHLGETVCEWLRAAGADPRPKDRPPQGRGLY